jgi:hypothetical protein
MLTFETAIVHGVYPKDKEYVEHCNEENRTATSASDLAKGTRYAETHKPKNPK